MGTEQDDRVYDENYCRMRCPQGSESGTCPCESPADCPDKPRITPMGLRMLHLVDQFEAKWSKPQDV